MDACRDEDYIDMEVTSPPTEFEFQSNDSQTNPAPADHLFFDGKLLPLHLPPPPQMLHSLLLLTSTTFEKHHYYTAPLVTSNTAPFANISPSESCRVSCELKPHGDILFEWSDELRSFGNHEMKNSWPKKLKQKLKSSRAYLRSLFFAKSDESSSSSSEYKYLKIGRTIAAVIRNVDKEGQDENGHRRSFSRALKRRSPTKCPSWSSSFNSKGVHELSFVRRNNDAIEIEASIAAAIAHCKRSLQSFQTADHGLNSLSDSKIGVGDGGIDERGNNMIYGEYL